MDRPARLSLGIAMAFLWWSSDCRVSCRYNSAARKRIQATQNMYTDITVAVSFGAPESIRSTRLSKRTTTISGLAY